MEINSHFRTTEECEFATPETDGEILSFHGFAGSLDLSELQESTPRRVRVTCDRTGQISVNAAADFWLIAEVDIPAAQYVEPVPEEEGQLQTKPERVPIETVEVLLWALPRV
jgi:hypothetical protein